jgi:hypothetical protein
MRVAREKYGPFMRGDRVEIVVDSGNGVLKYEIEATKAGRRVEVSTSRGTVEVTEGDEEWHRGQISSIHGLPSRRSRGAPGPADRSAESTSPREGSRISSLSDLVRHRVIVRLTDWKPAARRAPSRSSWCRQQPSVQRGIAHWNRIEDLPALASTSVAEVGGRPSPRGLLLADRVGRLCHTLGIGRAS